MLTIDGTCRMVMLDCVSGSVGLCRWGVQGEEGRGGYDDDDDDDRIRTWRSDVCGYG